MTKPAILAAIDAALETHLPRGVRVAAEAHILSEVQDYMGQPGAIVTEYEGVRIHRSLAQIPGDWAVRTVKGAEKPDEQPRDPETGKFLSWGGA